MIVMKFGGASLSETKNIGKTCDIVATYAKKGKVVLVVSAMKGVTDQLYRIVNHLQSKKLSSALRILEHLKQLHMSTLSSVTDRPDGVKVEIELTKLFGLLENFIRNAAQKEITKAREDYIVSFGERLSSRIVAEALENNNLLAYPIDASYLMATTDQFGNALPISSKSKNPIKTVLLPLLNKNIIPVITGFIGFTHDGCTTTLGRGGSDLSAAFFANFLNASGLYLWKDVEGFYTNDPHKDKEARLYKKLSYRKAEMMAKEGAKIIYYKAIKPIQTKKIPLHVKSFLHPQAEGTVIC